ncbi:MAG: hypothetical protein GF334_08530 [Candidatus Altiarchaeales archaeon]|nr:hypothetical protein [Candidatus Altiarchaeales archaeon]
MPEEFDYVVINQFLTRNDGKKMTDKDATHVTKLLLETMGDAGYTCQGTTNLVNDEE